MEGSSEDVLKARRQRKEEAAELVRNEWKSTGDLPYHIARSVKKSAGTIASFMATFLAQTLEQQGETYRKENVKDVGVKRFVSPDLAQKIEEKVKEYYLENKSYF
jgi:hypothetical protein